MQPDDKTTRPPFAHRTTGRPFDPPYSMDFAGIEQRVLASMLSKRESVELQTSITAADTPTLTLEMLEEMLADADRENQKLMEQEIEAFFAAGCRIVVNEFVPDGKLLVLPKEYSEALERVLKRMRGQARASAFDLFYGAPPAYYRSDVS